MAEKSFGVKEVNLIGASGTPTITSPNNLNLNAVNVAISTNATIGGNLSVSGTVGIAGTLTYEDVTNIDSVGIITAQKDIHVGAGLSVVGVSTLTGAVNSSANITTTLDLNSRYLYVKDIFMEDVSPELRFVDTDNDPNYRIRLNSGLLGIRDITNNVDKLVFNTSGMVATGIVTATTFSGSGASLTNLPLSNTDVQVLYTLTANGSSAYRFAGNGIVSTEDNPDVYLIRGLKYRFVNNSGGSHPFQIRQSSGGSAYSAGVTNNGAASGNIDFQVPYSAPSHLYYQCTSHGGMVGNLYIRGAGGQNDNVGVTTFSGAVNVTAAITADDFRTDSSSSTLYLTSANDWRFRTTSGHERVRITSTGNMKVGFVNNINPTTVFDVMASAINQDIVRFTGANHNRGLKISTAASGATNDALIKYDAESQSSAGQHAFLTDGIERLRITNDGDIYTSNDQVRDNARLTITNNVVGVSTSIHLHNANGSGTATKISASKSIILSADFDANSGANSSYISFETDATERLRIASDGTIHVNSPDSASGGRIWGNSSQLYLQSGNGRQTFKVSDAAAGVNRTYEITTDGHLKFPAGYGIEFSGGTPNAGSSPTVNSAVFDDYEEGKFVPKFLEDATTEASYAWQYGQYVKVAGIVHIRLAFGLNGFNSSGGTFTTAWIGGMPYTHASQWGTSDFSYIELHGYSWASNYGDSGNTTALFLELSQNADKFRIVNGTGKGNVNQSSIGTGQRFAVTFSYPVA